MSDRTSYLFVVSILFVEFEKDFVVFAVSHFGQIHVQFVFWIVLYSSSSTKAHWLCRQSLQVSHSMARLCLKTFSSQIPHAAAQLEQNHFSSEFCKRL